MSGGLALMKMKLRGVWNKNRCSVASPVQTKDCVGVASRLALGGQPGGLTEYCIGRTKRAAR